MSSFGRLTAILLLHIGLQVRITVTVCCLAPVDATGVIQNMEPEPSDCVRWLQHPGELIFMPHRTPTAIGQADNETIDTSLGPDMTAVEAVICKQIVFEITLDNHWCSGACCLNVRA